MSAPHECPDDPPNENRVLNSEKSDRELLDLLVDGELSLTEQRELVARLDQTEDGWKQCAQAFLEAQAWRGEFSRAEELFEAPVAATVAPKESSSTGRVGRWSSLLSLAASFFLACSLGIFLGSGDVNHVPTADNKTSPPPSVRPSDPATHRASDRATDDATRSLPDVNLAVGSSPDASKIHYAGDLTFESEDATTTAFRLPVLEGPGAEEVVLEHPSSMPEHVVRALERTGHKVNQQRRYVPVSLQDGRRIVVPYEEVEVQFIGDRPYH
ncbi:MAG: hypothetical protein N2C14_21435 [Planctomycetales bacterium]